MFLDTPTIFFTAAAMCFPVAGLLFLSWRQNRAERTLLWWSGGLFAASVGLTLLVLEGDISEILSIDIANALLVLGISLGWAGARAFNGSRISPFVIFLGPAVWLVLCAVPAIHDSLPVRVAVFSAMYAGYTGALAHEYWRGRVDGLASRTALAATFLLISGIFLLRSLAAVFVPPKAADAYLQPDPFTALFVMLPIVLCIANAVLVIAATKDRAEAEQRRLAETDQLTQTRNRGATLAAASERLANGPGAMLLFDLDRFKQINDRFGHPAGDRVLVAFAAVAEANLRDGDVFGRIGGEEFLAFLPGAGRIDAMAVGERIRAEFANTMIDNDGAHMQATVSIGIAVSGAAADDFDPLLIEADRALYLAKENGRDRVQFFVPRAA